MDKMLASELVESDIIDILPALSWLRRKGYMSDDEYNTNYMDAATNYAIVDSVKINPFDIVIYNDICNVSLPTNFRIERINHRKA